MTFAAPFGLTYGAQPRKESAVDLVIRSAVAPADVPALCERVRASLAAGDPDVVCDVGGLVDPDLATVDALARLQLGVRRMGGNIELRGACVRLRELVEMAGLSEVLRVEAGGHPEHGEEVRRVEEEDDPADPAP